MHEVSLVSALVDQMQKTADENHLTAIDEVEVEIGCLRQVIPEVFRTAFESVTKGTLAEGADLKIKEIRAEARCRSCDQVYEPTSDDFTCPSCTRVDVEILKGDSIVLKSISCLKKDEVAV
jgi:hydrogenase nickel incorporation protein HypA/HybF